MSTRTSGARSVRPNQSNHMKIYRPVLTNNCTQRFNENLAWVKCHPDGSMVQPLMVTKSPIKPDGYQSLYRKSGLLGHPGIDWAAWRGEAVYFPVADTERWTCTAFPDALAQGNTVVCTNGAWELRFLHFSALAFQGTRPFEPGQMLGFAGDTGSASGVHVHMELAPIREGTGKVIPENGFRGNIDPGFFLQDAFVGEKYTLEGAPHPLVAWLKSFFT